MLIPQAPQYAFHDTFNLNLGYTCSSSYGSKRDRASTSLSDLEDDDNDNNTDDYSTDIGYEMEMKKVRNNIFLDRQTICSDLQKEIDPHSLDQRGGHFYTRESTTQDNNSNNSCSDIPNISSSNTSSSEHRISSSSHTTTTTLSSSSSCGSSLRSDLSLSSRPYKREINSNNSNFSEKQCSSTHLNIIHNAKHPIKHLRIHSKMTSSNNNSGSDSNSVNDRSSSSSSAMDTNVDSPITDGNDSA